MATNRYAFAALAHTTREDPSALPCPATARRGPSRCDRRMRHSMLGTPDPPRLTRPNQLLVQIQTGRRQSTPDDSRTAGGHLRDVPRCINTIEHHQTPPTCAPARRRHSPSSSALPGLAGRATSARPPTPDPAGAVPGRAPCRRRHDLPLNLVSPAGRGPRAHNDFSVRRPHRASGANPSSPASSRRPRLTGADETRERKTLGTASPLAKTTAAVPVRPGPPATIGADAMSRKRDHRQIPATPHPHQLPANVAKSPVPAGSLTAPRD